MNDTPIDPDVAPDVEASVGHLVKTTHPARGALWGIVFGLGLVIVTIVTTVIPLRLVPAVLVLLVGIAVGTLWSLFGPAKAPRT